MLQQLLLLLNKKDSFNADILTETNKLRTVTVMQGWIIFKSLWFPTQKDNGIFPLNLGLELNRVAINNELDLNALYSEIVFMNERHIYDFWRANAIRRGQSLRLRPVSIMVECNLVTCQQPPPLRQKSLRNHKKLSVFGL